MNETVVFLCDAASLTRERRGFSRALAKLGVQVICYEGASPQGPLRAFIDGMEHPPIAVVQVDTGFLPRDVEHLKVPTLCMQIDSYGALDWRAHWSRLFDGVITFHAGTEGAFRRAGNTKVYCLPHAVEADAFSGAQLPRIHEVGWVGSLAGELYARRRGILPALAKRFKLNDYARPHTYEEMALVLKQSRIGVNISRDDCPQPANLRCFEVMAAGALLITDLPTDLEQYGFQCGQDFVGFRSTDEIPNILERMLADERKLASIAESGRAKVLSGHTYAHRAQALIDLCRDSSLAGSAAARSLQRAEVESIYAHYYAKNLQWRNAVTSFVRTAAQSPVQAVRVMPAVGWSAVRIAQRFLRKVTR